MGQERLDRVAQRQHGLFTITQARGSGLTNRQVEHGDRTGRWTRLYQGVYRMAGAPATDLQALLAAVLACGPGAAASHRGAAWLWGLADDVQLDVTGTTNRRPAVAIRYRRVRAEVRIVGRRGVPCTDPLRTMLDLAGLGDRAAVVTALDRGVASGLFGVPAVKAELERRRRSGVAGVSLLQACLGERLDAGGGRTSVLESAMDRLVRRMRLPAPERQYPFGPYRLDYAWPGARVLVEVDGYGPHSSVTAFQHDRERQNALVLAGWTVLRFTWDDVCRRPAMVAAAIRRALVASRPA